MDTVSGSRKYFQNIADNSYYRNSMNRSFVSVFYKELKRFQRRPKFIFLRSYFRTGILKILSILTFVTFDILTQCCVPATNNESVYLCSFRQTTHHTKIRWEEIRWVHSLKLPVQFRTRTTQVYIVNMDTIRGECGKIREI